MEKIIAWWSAGVTSAVATKLVLVRSGATQAVYRK